MSRFRKVSIVLFVCSAIIAGICGFKTTAGKDPSGPVFAMDSDTVSMSVKDGERGMLAGITANDAADGDVTDSIIVESITPFTEEGYRVVNYAAVDSDDHVSHASRKLYYTDYTSPRFSLNGPMSFPLNSTDLLTDVKAEDCIDGDISENISISSKIQILTTNVGYFDIWLEVYNNAGDVSRVKTTMEVYDQAERIKLPRINLSDYIVYIEKGAKFDAKSYIRSLTVSGTDYTPVKGAGTYGTEQEGRTVGLDRFAIQSAVNTNIPDCYEVTYGFEDTVNNTGTGTTRLIVVVTEGDNAND